MAGSFLRPSSRRSSTRIEVMRAWVRGYTAGGSTCPAATRLLGKPGLLHKSHLQIFSGCVCHLEQLHAQSPFLLPIVFGINLIPFFNIGSVLAVPCSGMRFFIQAAARSQLSLFVALAAGLWCFTAGCHVKSVPLPSLKLKCAPQWEKA